MPLKKQPLILLILMHTFVFAQNMKPGFNYLETGNYTKAVSFFKAVLNDYPDNKTARLCYGRAIGLSGDADTAVTLFTNLLKDYPNDFEVKLNYAESLLWAKQFENAKSYYKGLVAENEKSFSALLGNANTLSNLKEYEDALNYVNKALAVKPGNANALTSKKYIYLGYAYKNQQAQNYTKAETLLKENLSLFPNDKDTLLNLANLYLITGAYDKAKTIYETLGEAPENRISSLKNLALVYHLKGKEKNALALSKIAYQAIDSIPDTTLVKQTKERYIQALIWNKKFKTAKQLVNNLIEEKPNENWVLALRATLNIYLSNFKRSVTDYNRILENDSSSFDGNLGKANTLKALGDYKGAYQAANATLKFYNKQKDATQFIKTLDRQFTPFIDTKTSYTFDNGDNIAYAASTQLELPASLKFKWLANYGYRTTSNDVTNNDAESHTINLGFNYQLLPRVAVKGIGGITAANANNRTFTQLNTTIALSIKPFKLQNLDIGYLREIQNFNAELIDREIVMNNFYANYSLSTNYNIGWFTQYYHTPQSDNNTRNLLFTSLYYNILAKPALKAGINYQYITFKDQVPTIYFSPERFNAVEVFLNLIKTEDAAKPKTWYYELTAATGYQFIEDDPRQSTYRVQGKLGYRFTKRAFANIFGTRSNIASATAAGFTFNEIGLCFKWYLSHKPIFKTSN